MVSSSSSSSSSSSIFDFKPALNLKSAEFIAWACKDAIMLLFFVIFTFTYCCGRHETYRHDHKVFQRLRLLIILTCFADFWWPFQYYFHLHLDARIVILSLASSADFLTGIIIILLSLRVFRAYYHTKHHQSTKGKNNTLPCYLNAIMIIYLCGYTMGVITEVLAFSYTTFPKNTYIIIIAVWFAINSIYTLTLISFLLKITTLFKQTNVNSLLISPAPPQSMTFQQPQCSIVETRQLYVKMIFLCTGFILYYLNLLGAYLYFFITWNFNVSDKPLWIIDHEIVGHFILYLTFYSYLRVRHVSVADANVYDRNNDNVSNDLVYNDRLEVQRNKQNKDKLVDETYHNSYGDLGKLCQSLDSNSIIRERVKTKSDKSYSYTTSAAVMTNSKPKTVDHLSVDSSLSNTVSSADHSHT